MAPDERDMPGREIDKVVLEIDYSIIEHFSRYLYGSPNKAVEELVANAFDAMATDVFIYVPGAQVTDRVLVWDDGLSMDKAELKSLWWIAKSPKTEGARVGNAPGLRERLMIGKFGIGKLASYQVGEGIAHLCKSADGFLLVDVDYRDVESDLKPEQPPKRYETPIYQMTEKEAREWVEKMFVRTPKALGELWGRPHWTLAIIYPLKDIDLLPGRLAWVLSSSMPLRSDFRITVNDEKVVPRVLAGEFESWTLGTPAVKEAVKQGWVRAKSRNEVTGDLVFPTKKDDHEGGPAIVFPNLGPTRAEIRLFRASLNTGAAAEYGRSYGFFLRVRERLVNMSDPQLAFRDPSFGTFYRTQFVIHADSLDEDLLADRERLRLDTPRMKELAVLQDVLYLAARQRFDRYDEAVAKEELSESLLPIGDRTYFREPFTSLLLKTGKGAEGIDISQAHIEREARSEEDPIADLDASGTGFTVNTEHPFLKAVSERLGGGRKAREALRALDLVAVSETLFAGFLFDMGLDAERIDRILKWREGLYRSLALRYGKTADDVFAEVERTSYLGKDKFEQSLADLFGLMGFEATRHGGPGEKDVLVISPTGETQVKFTVEGKGSRRPVPNDRAEVGGAVAHRETEHAEHAIIVAREFAGFERGGDDAAILAECRATGRVSIVTVETLIQLAKAVLKFYYPLELILPVLAEIETPEAKQHRVEELVSPVQHFDFRRVLEELWRRQQGEAAGDVVPFRSVWQQGPWKDQMDFDEFTRKLVALEAMSGGLIVLRTEAHEIRLRQSPGIIADKIQASLEESRQSP